MIINGQFILDLSSPATRVLVVVAGLLALYLAFKIGYFILRMLLALAGLALLGGFIWWIFFGP